MNVDEAVQAALENRPDRNFTESLDLVINVHNMDLNDPDNRFSDDVKLPYQAAEDVTVCVIGETITTHADNADRLIAPDELDDIIEDEDAAKDLVESYDFFIAEAPLMPRIGKELGSLLGPRNKMPEPMEPGENPSDRIAELRSTVSLQLRESPSIKCKIGNEIMDEEELTRNAEAVINTVLQHLPQQEHNLKDVLVKTTMGQPVVVE